MRSTVSASRARILYGAAAVRRGYLNCAPAVIPDTSDQSTEALTPFTSTGC